MQVLCEVPGDHSQGVWCKIELDDWFQCLRLGIVGHQVEALLAGVRSLAGDRLFCPLVRESCLSSCLAMPLDSIAPLITRN
jgi:hypothetical protein